MLKLNRDYSDYTDLDDSNYPEGKAINASTSESYDGTPLLDSFMNDVNAAHIAMYEKAYGDRTGISGEADTQVSSQFADAVAKYTDDKVKEHADKRGLTDGVHGATSAATAGQIACRDASGNIAVGSAINDGDAVNKAYLNNLIESVLKEKIYHVGYIMYTDKADNPSTYLGFGTWVRIKGRFLWAADDNDKIGNTGGAKTVTLATTQIPSHTHTFTGSAVTSGGSSAANTGSTQPTFTGTAVTSGGESQNHTHSVTAAGTVAVKTNPTFTGSAVNTGGMSANSTGEANGWRWGRQGSAKGCFSKIAYNAGILDGWDNANDSYGAGLSINISHTHSVTAQGSISGGAYTFTGSAVTSGANSRGHTHSVTAAGTVSSHSHTMAHTHSVTAAGSNGNTGGGQAHENMPPYEIHYCWKRTA